MSTTVYKFFQLRNYFWYNLAFWSIIFFLELIQTLYFAETYFDGLERKYLIRWPVSVVLTYWSLSLLIIRVYIMGLPLKKWRFILFHLGISILFGICHRLIHPIVGLLLERLFLPTETLTFHQIVQSYFVIPWDFLSGVAMYWLLILIFTVLNYYRRLQDKSQQALELEAQLGASRLQWMKMQLNPHFLFNAFNTISMMVRNKKNEEAVEMISDLSNMLRNSLNQETRQFISLKEELELIEKYINIESLRYGDRIKIEWDVEKDLREWKVPSFVLQPIVENAFKHGISKSLQKEVIRIAIRQDKNRVLLSVFNSGSELAPDWEFQKSKGIGLANTSERLSKLYNGDAKLLIREMENGLEVTLDIPYE